jgi:hypothetical protein
MRIISLAPLAGRGQGEGQLLDMVEQGRGVHM